MDQKLLKNQLARESGTVTFLDVLGWKGIWQTDENPIRKLADVIEETKKIVNVISKDYDCALSKTRGKEIKTTVLSISDTIAIFTAAEPEVGIETHAKICAWLLPYALKASIPLREAISYGDYITHDNIMLGYAVDEAASWHEATDWIGVVLTPSAFIKVKKMNLGAVTTYNAIPFKRPVKNLNLCVDWTYDDKSELMDIIDKKGPLIPEIAPKYLNTLQFLEREKKDT